MCGLCLPHCPTYRYYRDEAESPRGRIALIAALAVGELEADVEVRGHLDRCLGCRACEAMCPSDVAYGRLYREARAELFPTPPEETANAFQAVLTTGRLRQRLLRGALRIYQKSGLQSAVRPRLHGDLGRLEAMLPELPSARRLPESLPAGSRGRVGLFTGCTGNLFDADTLAAAARVLNRLGFGVEVPRGQGCCGALDLAAGDLQAARDKAEANAGAFSAEPLHAIVGVASGCTATLRETGEWAAPVEGAAGMAAQVEDIVVFLSRLDWPEDLPPAPLTGPVAVHEPCSLRNVLKAGGATARLLECIPGFEPIPLPAGCCGAGGTHVLRYPEAADALRTETIRAIAESGARTVVSANIGCALHLAAGLREAGIDCEVVHPVTLLDRQLAAAGAYNQGQERLNGGTR